MILVIFLGENGIFLAFFLNFDKNIFHFCGMRQEFWIWYLWKIDQKLVSWLLTPDYTQHDVWYRATFLQFSVNLRDIWPLTPKIIANSGKTRYSGLLLGDGKVHYIESRLYLNRQRQNVFTCFSCVLTSDPIPKFQKFNFWKNLYCSGFEWTQTIVWETILGA